MARPTAGDAHKLIEEFELLRKRNGMSSLDLMWCHSISRELRDGVAHQSSEETVSELMYDKYIQLEGRLRAGVSLYKHAVTG